jgi:predicted lipoprotein with Yx(FWY)xxD motif
MLRPRSNVFGVDWRRMMCSFGALSLAGLGITLVSSTLAAAANRQTTILVTTKESSMVGRYLATANGYTLYTFSLDTRTTSACNGSCAKLWPPVLVNRGVKLSKVTHGLPSSRIGEIRRSNGTLQLTYEGKPLYRFEGDKAPGQLTGQGFEHVWFVAVVSPAPSAAALATSPTTAPAPSPAASSTNSNSGSTSSNSPAATSPPPTSPLPTSPPTTSPPTTSPPATSPPTTTQPPGGYGY